MNDIYKYVLESISTGKIDKQTAVKLIGDLKKLSIMPDKNANIAIIGMAVNFPMASSIEELWQNICNGVNCITEFPESRKKDIEDYISAYNQDIKASITGYQRGAYLEEIDKFDYNLFEISPKEASLMDPAQRLFLQTAWNAIEDAGYGGDKIRGSKTGVYVGNSNDFGERYKTYIRVISASDLDVSITGNINSIIAGRISHLMDLKGPSILFDTACSSSLVAVHAACKAIKDGECDMAIAGGIKLNLMPVINKYKENVEIESKESLTKAFDDNSDGTAFGEGVAVVFLKSLQKAIEDNDHIYATIKATAINHDGNSIGITAPNPEAQCNVILKAWKDADINAEDISYIEAHGTGTKLGDPIEINGIESAFKKHTTKKQFCAIASIKTNLGHLDNAAGIAGLVKAALALYYKKIPPNLHFNRPNKKISFETSPVYINDRLSDWHVTKSSKRLCGVSSFGLSGTNCHAVLEEVINQESNDLKQIEKNCIITISAGNKDSLMNLLDRYDEFLKRTAVPNIQDISYTANTGRWHLSIRVAILAKNTEELKNCIETLRSSNINTLAIKGVFIVKGIIKTIEYKKEKETLSEDKIREIGRSIHQKINIINQLDIEQYNIFMEEISEAYIKGICIKWEELYDNKLYRKVRLPLYPYRKSRCWVESKESNKFQHQVARKQEGICNNELGKDTHDSNTFYCVEWVKASLPVAETNKALKGKILIFEDKHGFYRGLVDKLNRNFGIEIIEVKYGSQYEKVNSNKYIIDSKQEDFDALFNEVGAVDKIIHLSSLFLNQDIEQLEQLEEAILLGLTGLFYMIKSLNRLKIFKHLDLYVISDYADGVMGKEAILKPHNATIGGFIRAISSECYFIRAKFIDIDECVSIFDILTEISVMDREKHIAFRNGERYIPQIAFRRPSENENDKVKIIEGGTYIIAGGTGGIGLELGKYMSLKNKVNMCLISRTAIPPKSEWEHILKNKANKLYSKIEALKSIERNNSVVECYSGDISCQEDLSKIITNIRGKYKKINGIINCAGVAGECLLYEKEEESFYEIINPKIKGTWLLDSLTQKEELDFFMMFSSATTMVATMYQVDYTAANAFMDCYSSYRNNKGKRTYTINWPAWKDIGMAVDSGIDIEKGLFKSISTHAAVSKLESVFDKGYRRVFIGEININSSLIHSNLCMNFSPNIIKWIGELADNEIVNDDTYSVILTGRESGEYSDLEKGIASVWSKILGVYQVDIKDNFFDLGGNSIIAVKFETEMEYIGVNVGFSVMDKYPTLKELSKYIIENGFYKGQVTKEINEISQKDVNLHKKIECEHGQTNYIIECSDKKSNILKGIKPFNSLFFKGCFYNAFFPIVKYFSLNCLPYLTNEVITYKSIEEEKFSFISTNYISQRDFEKILCEEGMDMNCLVQSDNLIKDIEISLVKENPVIISIDCFYESIRNDTFLKKHWPHNILIYGFDKIKEELYILEHRNKDNLYYDQKVIKYEDIANSYQGYLANFKNLDSINSSHSKLVYNDSIEHNTFYSFGYNKDDINYNLFNECKNSKILKTFFEHMSYHKDEVYSGKVVLTNFCKTIEEIISNEELFNTKSNKILDSLNEIINAKKIEKYRFELFFSYKSELVEILDSIIELWKLIRSYIIKCQYLKKYDKNLLITILKSLDKLMILEEKQIDTSYKVLQSKIKK